MAQEPNRPIRHFGGELVIPILAVVFTLYYFTTIWNSPWTAQVGAFSIGGILLVLCMMFFVVTGRALAKGEGRATFGNLFTYEDLRTGRIGLFATTIGYCWFIDDLGFTLATFLFLWLSMMILGKLRRIGLVTIISAVLSFGGWAVFIWAFDTRFPRGWFEETMRTLLSNG